MKVHHLLSVLLFFICFNYGNVIGQETCPAYDDITGECKLQCQCINEPGKCLSNEQFCDGKNDCLDGQDEEDCCQTCPEGWAETCKPDEFKCHCDCHCYPTVCDGVKQCSDGSDEKDCPVNTTPWWIWLIVALVILVALVVLTFVTHLIIKHHKKKDKYVVEGAKPYRRGKENAAFSASMSQPSL